MPGLHTFVDRSGEPGAAKVADTPDEGGGGWRLRLWLGLRLLLTHQAAVHSPHQLLVVVNVLVDAVPLQKTYV